jgi:ligand-binding sensor domain-containing protein
VGGFLDWRPSVPEGWQDSRDVRVADGLGEGFVAHLRTDRDGALWAATAGGLSRVKDGRVRTLSKSSGLPCDTIHWSMEDNSRTLWMYRPVGWCESLAPISTRGSPTRTTYRHEALGCGGWRPSPNECSGLFAAGDETGRWKAVVRRRRRNPGGRSRSHAVQFCAATGVRRTDRRGQQVLTRSRMA